MIKYEVQGGKRRKVWLEVEELGWAWVVEEIKLRNGAWDRSSIRVPIEGLRKALAQVTIKHEVG